MTQVPPPPAFPDQPAFQPTPSAPRTNGWAIASLICGILGCLGITGLLAIVFGIVGIKKSSEPGVGGKGLSIAGIIIGFLMLLGTAGLVGTGVWGYGVAKRLVLQPANDITSGFLSTLANGNTAAAKTHTTGDMTDEQIQDLQQKLKSSGNFKNLSLTSFDAKKSSGNTMRIHVGGTAHFDNASKSFSADIVGVISGTKSELKIEDFKLD